MQPATARSHPQQPAAASSSSQQHSKQQQAVTASSNKQQQAAVFTNDAQACGVPTLCAHTFLSPPVIIGTMAAGSSEFDLPWEIGQEDFPLPFEAAGFNEDDIDSDVGWEKRVPNRREGEQGLADFLVHRYTRGLMPATDVCVISFWAHAAGATGFVSKLAKAPGGSSGHYARHLRQVLKLGEYEERLMHITVPSHLKQDMAKVDIDIPVLPPHEALQHEVSENPGVHQLLVDAKSRGGAPTNVPRTPSGASFGG